MIFKKLKPIIAKFVALFFSVFSLSSIRRISLKWDVSQNDLQRNLLLVSEWLEVEVAKQTIINAIENEYIQQHQIHWLLWFEHSFCVLNTTKTIEQLNIMTNFHISENCISIHVSTVEHC